MIELRWITETVYSPCQRCGCDQHPPIGGFFHDIRCFSLRTALYNVYFRFGLALGLFEPEYDING